MSEASGTSAPTVAATACAPTIPATAVAPTIPPPTAVTLSNATIQDDQPAGTVVGTLSTTDADAADTFTYKLLAGKADDALFNVKGHTLKTKAKLKAGTYKVKVRALDAAGHITKQVFIITVA